MEKSILNLIDEAKKVLIITHVNPDGDTLGSASALKSFIGEKAEILIQIKDNFNFPSTYSFLPHINTSLNLSNVSKNKYDLIIAVDIASIDRIVDSAREIFKQTQNTILIDHHKTNKGYAKINYIKGGISSTGEVLYDLFKELNIEITKDIAAALYAAILTDTGCFKYESTTPHTFKIVSELSEIGINTSKIADLCYINKPKKMVLFQNEAILNARFCLDDKIAYTLITQELIDKYNAKNEYTEGICEVLRSISGVEVAFVLKEAEDGVKASFRTKNIDATLIVQKYNGGGHKRASGCTIKTGIYQAAQELIIDIKRFL